MKAPVQRKLPGTSIPRDQLIADREDRRCRSSMAGPVASFLFEVHHSEPEKTYQWRVQLDCGCVRDALTSHHTDDKPADKVERLGELASTYHFAHVRPSEREIAEAREQAGKEAERAARAKVTGTEMPDEPELPSIFGEATLKAGQLVCEDPGCPDYRRRGPVRDITEWVRLRDNPFVMEPLELDGETIRGAREYAVWDVVLSCGHFAQEHTAPGWKPEDGHPQRKRKTQRPLQDVLDIIAQGDPDEEAYWRRRYDENHPYPTPFTRCHTCACIRTITAYQRIGWLAPRKSQSPPKPIKVNRKTLERRLAKLEAEAAQLRQQIDTSSVDD